MNSAGSKSACGSSCLSGCILTYSCVKWKSFQLYFINNLAFSNISIHHSFNGITLFATLTFSFEIFGAFSVKFHENLYLICAFYFPLDHSHRLCLLFFDASYRPISFILHEDDGWTQWPPQVPSNPTILQWTSYSLTDI